MTSDARRAAAAVALVLGIGTCALAGLAGAESGPKDREGSHGAAESDRTGPKRMDAGSSAGTDAAESDGETRSDDVSGGDDHAKGDDHSGGGHHSETAARNIAPEGERISPREKKAGRRAFHDVAKVLKSPRCMNCHPNGNRPLQTDESRPHALNISRKSVRNGLECSSCHLDRNSEAYGVEGGPPGAPHWGLPPKHTPMIFEGRTHPELCRQLKDPERNGGKDLDALYVHVAEDPLVLWGWNPGGDRTKPPLSHDEFVEAFRTWVESGGACPTSER